MCIHYFFDNLTSNGISMQVILLLKPIYFQNARYACYSWFIMIIKQILIATNKEEVKSPSPILHMYLCWIGWFNNNNTELHRSVVGWGGWGALTHYLVSPNCEIREVSCDISA